MEWTTVGGINCYQSQNIHPEDFPNETFEMYSVPCYDDDSPEIVRGSTIGSSKQAIQEGDVLLCKINPRINRVWTVTHHTKHRLLASSEWIVVRTKDYLPQYLRYYFSSPYFRLLMTEHVVGIGGSLTRVQPKLVKTYPVPILTLAEQKAIVSRLSTLDVAIANRRHVLALLSDLPKARFVEMFGDPMLNPMGFPVHQLKDIASTRLGKMLDAKKQTGKHSFPYLANYNVQWFHFQLEKLNQMDFDEADQKEFDLHPGDLMVCEGGEIGRCAIWQGEITNCYFQKALHRVRCDTTKILPEYLAYTFFWHSKYNGFKDVMSGVSTIAHLPGARLKKIEVIVPPLSAQRKFATFARACTTQRAACARQIAALETLRKKLLQDAFGAAE
jgi:type I restriction enzyme S subunit